MSNTPEIDITNRWLIGLKGDGFTIMLPPRTLTKAEALVFAAYLVAMVGDDEQWCKTLDEVMNT